MHPQVNKVCGGFMCVRGRSGLCHVSVFFKYLCIHINCKKPGFVECSLITDMCLCVGVVTYIVPLIIKLSNNYKRERKKRERGKNMQGKYLHRKTRVLFYIFVPIELSM